MCTIRLVHMCDIIHHHSMASKHTHTHTHTYVYTYICSFSQVRCQSYSIANLVSELAFEHVYCLRRTRPTRLRRRIRRYNSSIPPHQSVTLLASKDKGEGVLSVCVHVCLCVYMCLGAGCGCGCGCGCSCGCGCVRDRE